MSGNMTEFYRQQHFMDGMVPNMEPFFDANVVTRTSTLTNMSLDEGNSYNTNSGHLTPKGSNAFKPIRRRCRASKRTPTTLLNANTTNFRELVQKFTGCASTTTSVMSSFEVHKGPITLNFQQGSKLQKIQQYDTSGRSTMPPFRSTARSYYNYNQGHHHEVDVPLIPWQGQQDQVPKQQSGYSDDGLLMVDDFSLHELSVSAFSNDIKNDGFSHLMN